MDEKFSQDKARDIAKAMVEGHFGIVINDDYAMERKAIKSPKYNDTTAEYELYTQRNQGALDISDAVMMYDLFQVLKEVYNIKGGKIVVAEDGNKTAITVSFKMGTPKAPNDQQEMDLQPEEPKEPLTIAGEEVKPEGETADLETEQTEPENDIEDAEVSEVQDVESTEVQDETSEDNND